MKIVIATGIFPPQIGGPATYSKLIADVLPEFGHETAVVNFGSVIRLPKGISHFIYFVALMKSSLGADLIYVQDPVSVGFPALVVSKLLRKKLMLRLGGDYAWEQATQKYGVKDPLDVFCRQYKQYAFRVRLLKRIQTLVARNSECVIVPSNYLKSVVVEWGIDPDKIIVIYNGFPIPSLSANEEAIRQNLGLASPAILSVGRLVPWKGFDTLIELMPKISELFPGATLYIAGDGPQKEVLEKKAAANGASVKFLGRLSQDALFAHIKAADLFVLNTAYEGFSHQLLEVMALGTPVITTDAGGNTELVEHEKNGLLFRYNDRKMLLALIQKMLADKAYALALAHNAVKKSKLFTDEQMVKRLLEVLARF